VLGDVETAGDTVEVPPEPGEPDGAVLAPIAGEVSGVGDVKAGGDAAGAAVGSEAARFASTTVSTMPTINSTSDKPNRTRDNGNRDDDSDSDKAVSLLMHYIDNQCRKLHAVSGYWSLFADFDRGESASCFGTNLFSVSLASS